MTEIQRPIVGVLVDNSTNLKLIKQKKHFWSYPRLSHLAKASEELQVPLYFFTSSNIDSINQQVIGTCFDNQEKAWKQEHFPLPDILYYRGGNLTGTNLGLFRQKEIPKINPVTFNKWNVISKLQGFPEVKGHLPYTKLFTQAEDLIRFFKSHNEAYLKGVRGGRGKQIFYIKKLPTGDFHYSHCVGKLQIGNVRNFNELLYRIKKFYNGNPFIIQTAIDLIKLGESRVDFRAEVQRNGTGKLTITGVMARVGKSQSPITIHSSAYPVEVFFKEYLNYTDERIDKLIAKIHNYLFTVYTAIEKCYGIFGEIGLDFGIDNSDNIWFIESNSVSSKVSLMKAYDDNTFHQAFLKPLQFARYLYLNKNLGENSLHYIKS